jgi:hypothetical protein
MTRLVFLLALGGCSFTLVHGPNADVLPPMVDDCTTSRAWPITDLVFAALFVAGGVGAIIEARSSSSGSKHGATAAISMLPFGIGFAMSSLVGFNRVGKCREPTEL